ncbi:MAG: hypothetical protein JKY11_07540 [Alphaproteobacteria bacterium]|nr:hypothetical protein [Alphaproteobacteria bacterium]
MNTPVNTTTALRERFCLSVMPETCNLGDPKMDFVAEEDRDGTWSIRIEPFKGGSFRQDQGAHKKVRDIISHLKQSRGYSETQPAPADGRFEMGNSFVKTVRSMDHAVTEFRNFRTFLIENSLGDIVGQDMITKPQSWSGAKLISQIN